MRVYLGRIPSRKYPELKVKAGIIVRDSGRWRRRRRPLTLVPQQKGFIGSTIVHEVVIQLENPTVDNSRAGIGNWC
jgi:hypothetical protein